MVSLPFIFMAVSLALLMAGSRWCWVGVFLALATGVYSGNVSLVGLLISLGYLGATFLITKLEDKLLFVGQACIVIVSLLLAAHILPGFEPWIYLSDVQASPNSSNYTLAFGLDKPLIAFTLLLLFPSALGTKKPFNSVHLLLVFLSLPVVLLLAWGFGLIKPEISFSYWFLVFAIKNLIFTCITEEIFFRGYIQQQLCKKLNAYGGMAIASVLFGVAHFGGGIIYVALATLAGFLYGLAFLLTGRLYIAILAHFTLNMIHIIFFTYPLLQ